MHAFRLLDMALEIGLTGQIQVRRANREALLRIKKGEFSYEELVGKAEEKLQEIEQVFERSNLPEKPDMNRINQLLVEMRQEWYTYTS